MLASNVLGIVYSNVYDECISELTSMRTMGSVPFAGRYRLIDFILSDMVNCGITKVGISTKSNYKSLMDHLGTGKPWDLSRKREGMTILPPFNSGNAGMFGNRIEALDAIKDYIARSNKDYILFADCNVICNLDYGTLIDSHIESGADITIAYKRGVKPALENTMSFEFDGTRIKKVAVGAGVTSEASDYSLNIVVIGRVLLERLLNNAVANGYTSFERDIIAKNVDTLNIQGFKVDSFAKTIDSLQSYYDISMSLVNGEYTKLFDKDRPIYTKVRDDVPAIYGICAKAGNSLIADGCIIKGTVENSILFRGVYVAEGAVVKNSIVMQDAYISQGSKINCAILDKSVVVRPNREISGAETYPVYIGKEITV